MVARDVFGRSPRRVLGFALAVALCAIAVLTAIGALGASQQGALMMLPALLLAVALLAGRYPGERLIARWGRARPRARQATARVPMPSHASLQTLRGGRLIAASLAGRAPPVFAAG